MMMASYQDLRFNNGSSRTLIAREKPRRVERKSSALQKLFNPRKVERKSSNQSRTRDSADPSMAGKEISFDPSMAGKEISFETKTHETKTHVRSRRHRMMGQSAARSEPVVASQAATASSELRWNESKTIVSCDTTAVNSRDMMGSSNSSLRVREIMDDSRRTSDPLPRHPEVEDEQQETTNQEETTTTKTEEVVTAAHFEIELTNDSEQGLGRGWKARSSNGSLRHSKVTASMDQRSCYTTRTGRSRRKTRGGAGGRRANCEDKLPHLPGQNHESPTRDNITVATEPLTRDDRTSVSEQPKRTRTFGGTDDNLLKGRKACPSMRDRFTKDKSDTRNHNNPKREHSGRSQRSAPAQPRSRPEMPSWRSEAPRRSNSWQEDHHYEYDHRRYEQRESRRYDPRFDDYDYEYSASASQSRMDSRSHYQGSYDDYGSYHGSHHGSHHGSYAPPPRYDAYRPGPEGYDVYDHIARSTRSLHGYGGQEPVVVVIQMPPSYDRYGRPHVPHHSYHGPPPPPPPRSHHSEHDYPVNKEVPPVVEAEIPAPPQQQEKQEQPVGPDDPVYIEIGAGINARLRRTKETMAAIGRDFYVPATCMGCSADQFCIADCQYIYCCKCYSVSPLKECETNESTKKFTVREGVGMGFDHETLFQVQSELAEEKKKKNNVSC